MKKHMIQSKVKLHGKHDDAAGKDAKRRVVQQDKRFTMFCRTRIRVSYDETRKVCN